MAFEEFGFALERVGHALVGIDVPLRAVHNADKAELERVDTSREYVERVRARVHQVELRQDADRPPALGVDGPRELERIRVGEVDVRRGDGEDDAGICERLAGEQARHRLAYQLGFEMYSRTRVRICLSISLGWSPTGIYNRGIK